MEKTEKNKIIQSLNEIKKFLICNLVIIVILALFSGYVGLSQKVGYTMYFKVLGTMSCLIFVFSGLSYKKISDILKQLNN